MKKTTKTIEPMGNKVRASILSVVDKEDKAFNSQQDRLKDVLAEVEKHFGVPEKATGYCHVVHRAMIEAGRDVPAKYTDAIQDKGTCGKFLKRLYDFIRNSGDAPESKGFNPESYIKAVAKKCEAHPELIPALSALLKSLKK